MCPQLACLLLALLGWQNPCGQPIVNQSEEAQPEKVACTRPYGDLAPACVVARLGMVRRRLPVPAQHGIHVVPSGTMFVAANRFVGVYLCGATTDMSVLQWRAHGDAILSLAFTPDGRFLVSGALGGAVRLWEVASGRQLRELAGQPDRADVVAVTPDGKAILSCGLGGWIRVQDRDGTQLRRMYRTGHVRALSLTPDGKMAATWSSPPDGGQSSYDLWDLTTGKSLNTRADTSSVVAVPQFSPDAQVVSEFLWEWGKGAVQAQGGAPGMRHDGLVCKGVVLREVATGREIQRLRQPEGFTHIQAFAPDGRSLVTVTRREERVRGGFSYEHGLHIWELATGKERQILSCAAYTHIIQRVAYAPDGRTLATAYSDGTIQSWDLSTGKALPRQTLHSDDQNSGKALPRRTPDGTSVTCLAFSPDSRLVASGHLDGVIMVWESRSGRVGVGRGERELEAAQLDRWWGDLTSADARKAYEVIIKLDGSPRRTIRFFRDRLRPIAEGAPEKLRQLIADLDSPEFQRREAAAKQLTALGERAGPALRRTLKAGPSAEQRRHIQQILKILKTELSGEALRNLRAVEVLELIATDEAQEVLRTLAGGVPEARLTQEARVSLTRLTKRVTPNR